MEEESSTQIEPDSVTLAENAVTAPPAEPKVAVDTADIPATLNLNELQALGPSEIQKLCRDFELRVHPGRTRHHQILDLIRAALGLGISVRGKK